MSHIQKLNITFFGTVLISEFAALALSQMTNGVLQLMASQLLLALPAVIYLILARQNVAASIRFHRISISNAVLMWVFTLLITPLMSLVNAISMLFSVNTTTGYMGGLSENTSLFFMIITAALIPCIMEEAVYRGVFYNGYRKVRPLAGIFLSALLFGLMHGNLNQFTYAFFMGMIFSLLIEATNSILASMLVHFFINLHSILLIHLLPKLLSTLENIYQTAVADGNSGLADLILGVTGGGFSLDDVLNQAAAVTLESSTLGTILASYGLTALICTFLAFIIYRLIAKNAGRWVYIKALFHKGEVKEQAGQELQNSSVFSGSWMFKTWKGLYTLPLMFAIGLCVVSIILNELASRRLI